MGNIYQSKHKGREVDEAIINVKKLDERVLKTEENILYLNEHKASTEIVPKSIQDLQKDGEALEWNGGALFAGDVVGVDSSGNTHTLTEKQPNDFVVNVLINGMGNDSVTVYSADKSFEDVKAAYDAGKQIYLLVNAAYVVPLYKASTVDFYFIKFGYSVPESNREAKTLLIRVSSSGWSVQYSFEYTKDDIDEISGYLKNQLVDKQPLDFIVNVTTTGTGGATTITDADKTFEEVFAAYEAGKRIYLLVNGNEIVPLYRSDGSRAVFVQFGFAGNETLYFEVTPSGWGVMPTPDYTYLELEEAIRNGDNAIMAELLPKINGKVDSQNISVVDKSVNLFDKSQPLDAGFVSYSGTVCSTSYSHFYFPIDLSKTYTFPVYVGYTGAVNAPKIAVYNMQKMYLGMITGVLSDDQATATVNLAADTMIDSVTGKEVDRTAAAYLCINILPADLNTFMIVEGNTYPDIYYSYSQGYALFSVDVIGTDSGNKTHKLSEKADIKEVSVLSNTVGGLTTEVAKNAEEVEKVNNLVGDFYSVTVGANLFNKNDDGILEGAYINLSSSTGAEKAQAAYFASGYIPIELGQDYCTIVNQSYFGASAASKIPCYDESFTYIGYVAGTITDATVKTAATFTFNINQDTVSSTITDVSAVKYVRLNYLLASIDTFMMVKGTEYPQIYQVYGEKNGIYPEKVFSPLKGKIISFVGDSICAGASSIPGGYGKLIANRCGMTYENLGVHGGTITAEVYRDDGTARFCISRAVENMRGDADFAIFEGGVNDASIDVPLGTITTGYTAALDDTTFAGAFESMLKQAVNRFAGKKIGYIFVHKMSDRFLSTDELGDVETHYTIAKKCCEKWGVPYLDLNAHCPLSRYVESLKNAYTNNQDGWHPNEEGYLKYYCDPIEHWLETL